MHFGHQRRFVGKQGDMIGDHYPPVDDDGMHAAPVGVVHQAVDRVVQRAPFRPPGVKKYQVGGLARLDGTDYVIHAQRRRAPYRTQLQRRFGRHHAHILAAVLVQHGGQIYGTQRFQQVGVVAGVGA